MLISHSLLTASPSVDTETEIQSFFAKSSKAYDPMRLKIPKIDVEAVKRDSGLLSEKLAEKIASLMNLSGGFTPGDDDDEDEDEDEEVSTHSADEDEEEDE